MPVCAEEITFSKTRVVGIDSSAVILRHVLNDDVGRFYQPIVVVPNRLQRTGFTGVERRAIVIPRGHVVGTAGKLIHAHVIAIDGPHIVELELQFLIGTCRQVVQTLPGGKTQGALICYQVFFKEGIAAGNSYACCDSGYESRC